jgi:hypothetical protein
MNTVRKMMLVPEHEFLNRVQLAEKPAEAKAAVGTQVAMEKLVDEPNMPVDVKAKLFSELLTRLINLKSAAPAQEAAPGIPHAVAPVARPRMKAKTIADNIAYRYRARANNLLRAIGTQWSPQGQLKRADGTSVDGTDITQLVNHAVNTTKRSAPPFGWVQFAQRIHALGVTQQLAPKLPANCARRRPAPVRRWEQR